MKAIYPGSFDPVTSGHVDIIQRAAKVFDEVVVALAVNLEKNPFFTIDERLAMLRDACSHLDNVRVDFFGGLLVDYVENQGAKVVIKGLRAVSDFEFELQMALTNKRLKDSVETLFMMTSAEYSFLSSSLVKELAAFGASLAGLVPKAVEDRFQAKMQQRRQEAIDL
jgi:pantetheine-phosphate adenylyltransferase